MSAIPGLTMDGYYYHPIYGAEALADEFVNRASQTARASTTSVTYSYRTPWCDTVTGVVGGTPSYTISIDNGDVRFVGVKLEDIFETVPIMSDQKRNQERKEALDAFDSLLDEEVNKE